MYKEISSVDFKDKYLISPEKYEIIDVRQPEEFTQIRIKWSKLIPLDKFGEHLNSIDWNKEVIFVCRSWSRSRYITQVLDQHWYNATNLAWWISILRFNCQECIESWNVDTKYFEKK